MPFAVTSPQPWDGEVPFIRKKAMRPMMRQVLGIVFLAVLTACASSAKRDIEGILDRTIGLVASKHFGDSPRGDPGVTCGEEVGEYGCLVVNRTGCRVWFSVDKQTDRITGWRYVGMPDICWRYTHGG